MRKREYRVVEQVRSSRPNTDVHSLSLHWAHVIIRYTQNSLTMAPHLWTDASGYRCYTDACSSVEFYSVAEVKALPSTVAWYAFHNNQFCIIGAQLVIVDHQGLLGLWHLWLKIMRS